MSTHTTPLVELERMNRALGDAVRAELGVALGSLRREDVRDVRHNYNVLRTTTGIENHDELARRAVKVLMLNRTIQAKIDERNELYRKEHTM